MLAGAGDSEVDVTCPWHPYLATTQPLEQRPICACDRRRPPTSPIWRGVPANLRTRGDVPNEICQRRGDFILSVSHRGLEEIATSGECPQQFLHIVVR